MLLVVNQICQLIHFASTASTRNTLQKKFHPTATT